MRQVFFFALVLNLICAGRASAVMLEAFQSVLSYMLPGEGRWVPVDFRCDSMQHEMHETFALAPSHAEDATYPRISLHYQEFAREQNPVEALFAQTRSLDSKGECLRSWTGKGERFLFLGLSEMEWRYQRDGRSLHGIWACYSCGKALLTVSCEAEAGAAFEKREEFERMLESVQLRPLDKGGRLLLEGAVLQPGAEAIALHLEYQQLQPTDPYGYYHLAGVYALMAEPDLALQELNRALELYPQMQEAVCSRALCYQMLGDCTRALPDYARCLELNTDQCHHFYNQACCLAVSGEVELALVQLRQALACGYDNWELLESDSDLEPVRATEEFLELQQEFRQH